MKKIGQGWQYTVYDIDGKRVMKKFHSWPKSFFVIFNDIFPFRDDSFFEIPSFIKGLKNSVNVSLEILERRNIPRQWIGNPIFINKYDFTQDKVLPLHDVLEKLDLIESKKIIDKFIEFNKRLLSFRIIDKSFNITKNYGLNNNDEIVLIDIGEIIDDKAKVETQIRNRAWDKHYVSGRISNVEVREYFISKMDREFGIIE